MGILIFFVLVVLAVVLISKSTKKTDNSALIQRDWDWVKYIAEYKNVVTSNSDKKLIDSILDDIKSKAILSDQAFKSIEYQISQKNFTKSDAYVATNNVSQELATSIAVDQPTSEQKSNFSTASTVQNIQTMPDDELGFSVLEAARAEKAHLANISLLLFFGAFLFVTSVGLFVTLGSASGWIRTVSVLVVSLAMYGVGLWIYRSKPALEIAGLTFVGISIAVMPLVGVAAYNYITGISPQAIWLLTSIICLGLYTHALFTIRKPLLNYVFIFTLLSTFESGVAIMKVPIYYYGWVMIAMGLGLQAISVYKNIWPDFKEASKTGSHIYIPLAIIISLATIQSQGYGQLGVTLLLGAAFYGLEAWRLKSDAESSQLLAIVSHLSLLAGLASLFYGFNSSLYQVGWLLAGLSVCQIIFLLAGSRQSVIFKNIASIALASMVVGLFLMTGHYMAMTAVLGLIMLESIFVWWWQNRDDTYVVAMLAWLILPNLYGLLAAVPHLSMNSLVMLNIASLALQTIFFITVIRPNPSVKLHGSARSILVLQTITVALIACMGEPIVTLGAVTLISLILLLLSFMDSNKNYWEVISGFIISLAVLRGWNNTILLPALMVALTFNILLALRFRSELNRWLSTGLWLLLPVGLGGLTTANVWSPAIYAWAYIFVMFGLIISRMIARGVVFASGKIPLTSYARTTSESYSFGYILAAGLAVVISLFSSQSQAHTTLILATLGLTIMFLAWIVEKDVDLIALLPLLLQAILVSAIRPPKSGNLLIFFILMSSSLAVGSYLLTLFLKESRKSKYLNLALTKQTTLAASFVAPGSFFYAANSLWVMPVSLGITGGMFFDYWHDAAQVKKEWAVGILTVALMWLMFVLGVREVQAYTHVLALMFAGFAWWRNILGNKKSSDDYIYAALAISTVPLIIQSLSADAGGIYGWWLLLEQVVFMVIGALIHKRFVVLWGLYVAIASVLYQLRNLGYVALAILAIFVIGMAIYQLQRNNKPKGEKPKEDSLNNTKQD